MIKAIFYAALSATMVSYTNAECANACNGHGRCTSYDMCICNRNWQANDCSERICQYGLAHVDTPKGDLNMDGSISGPDSPVAENNFAYPFGTTEQFPRMKNSDLGVTDNSAHYYMECSNKGTCNRQTGECECLDGYDGAACQRASCPGYPNSCSGHGVCKTIRQLANADYSNIYELWDKDSTMGCECDAGFSGPDCSLRQCKYGIDPLYLDDTATIKYSIFNFGILAAKNHHMPNFTDGQTDEDMLGYFRIRFFDAHGEDWVTGPISAGATCAEVVKALNDLPNDVIPGTMTDDQCVTATRNDVTTGFLVNDPSDNVYSTVNPFLAFWRTIDGRERRASAGNATHHVVSGQLYRIHFNQNPGKLREPEIEIYLDGKRPTLVVPGSEVFTKVWTDGNQGESNDYFGDHCDGVTVSINNAQQVVYLDGLDASEAAKLKYCLGESDFDENNNVEVYDWDHGNHDYPHLVKLVLSTGAMTDGGHYVALTYDANEDKFILLNPYRSNDNNGDDVFEVYTTKGVFARTSNSTGVMFDFASNEFYMSNQTKWLDSSNSEVFGGDLSCETTDGNSQFDYVVHCLNKSDIITFLSTNETARYYTNPDRINLYTVKKLHQETYTEFFTRVDVDGTTVGKPFYRQDFTFGGRSHVITTDLSSNWEHGYDDDYDGTLSGTSGFPLYYVYKFFPDSDSTYNFVAQCSNRGICNEEEGLCECFGGYTGDACSDQSSLAV